MPATYPLRYIYVVISKRQEGSRESGERLCPTLGVGNQLGDSHCLRRRLDARAGGYGADQARPIHRAQPRTPAAAACLWRPSADGGGLQPCCPAPGPPAEETGARAEPDDRLPRRRFGRPRDPAPPGSGRHACRGDRALGRRRNCRDHRLVGDSRPPRSQRLMPNQMKEPE